MIGTVIKLCRVRKAVPKGIMSRGFPSAILVNATSWECSKGISSKLAQTSTWTEGWLCKNLGVFVHAHKKKNNSNVCSGFYSRFTPQISSWRNSYSSCQTSFTTGAGCNDVDFTASSYAKSGSSVLHSPKNCSGWDAYCACRATRYQCTSKNL